MNKRYGFTILSMVLAFQGCAHSQTDKELDQKLAQETEVKSRADLKQEMKDRIDTAAGLTDEQRSQLNSLREATQQKVSQLSRQSLQLKSVLVKDLVSTNYNEDEVNLIKKRIHDLEEKKVSTLFDAADQANRIMGHNAVKNQQVFNNIFEVPHGRYD
jgi:PBP1b-binding outer membrane lipoprotein LpoB